MLQGIKNIYKQKPKNKMADILFKNALFEKEKKNQIEY